MTMRICGVGDNVVDRYVDRATMYPGGNALNVAVHARRRGADTGYIGVLGDDPAGRLVLDALVCEGVETTRTRVAEGPNAYAVVRVVDGDRTFDAGDHGVSMFSLDDADLAYLRGFDLVHTGDCSGLEGQVADIAGVTLVSFDFSGKPASYAVPILPHVHLATFSASDASDEDVDRIIRWAHDHGPRYVLLTRGARGAVLSDGVRRAAAPATPGPVVDTLGAGDAYVASVLVDLLAGRDLEHVVAAASAYAAGTCQSFGAFGYEAPDAVAPDQVTRQPIAPATRPSSV